MRNGHGYLQQYGTDEYGEPDWVVGALEEYPGAKQRSLKMKLIKFNDYGSQVLTGVVLN